MIFQVIVAPAPDANYKPKVITRINWTEGKTYAPQPAAKVGDKV